jgi:hypothetical protein
MNSYLYVLPFADNQHFKIGISERIDSRIGKHNSQYNLKVSDIKLIKSNAHNIKLLERLLLTVCPPLKDNSFTGTDGATEIRHVEHLSTCFNQIDNLVESLNLTYVDYVLPVKEKVPYKKSPKKSTERFKSSYMDRAMEMSRTFSYLDLLLDNAIKLERDNEYYIVVATIPENINVCYGDFIGTIDVDDEDGFHFFSYGLRSIERVGAKNNTGTYYLEFLPDKALNLMSTEDNLTYKTKLDRFINEFYYKKQQLTRINYVER